MIERLSWNLVWGFFKKAAPYLLIAAAVGYVLMLRHDLGNARDKIANYEDTFCLYGAEVEAKSCDPAKIYQVLQARMDESADRKSTLDRISREAQAAEQRSRAADAELNRAQQENSRKFSAAQRQIKDLQNRVSSGNPQTDCKTIEVDSMAPWKDWK